MVQSLLIFSFLLLLGEQAASVPTNYDFDERTVRYYQDQLMMNRFQHQVAREMLSKSKLGNKLASAKLPCITGATAPTMYEWTIKSLINSVFPVFADTPSQTLFYVTMDYGKSILDNTDPLRVFYELENQLSTYPSKIWLNYPPYINTSHYLIDFFPQGVSKPTLEIMGTFAVEDLTSTIEQLKCLAKLEYLGFTLKPWDYQDFKNHLNQNQCKTLFDTAEKTAGFVNEVNIVRDLLNYVKQVSQSSNVQHWCIPPSSMLAKLQGYRFVTFE